jgi:hypothetical protein
MHPTVPEYAVTVRVANLRDKDADSTHGLPLLNRRYADEEVRVHAFRPARPRSRRVLNVAGIEFGRVSPDGLPRG